LRVVRIVGLLCLGLLLACSGCGGPPPTAGCRIGGVTSEGDPCNAANQAVGAFSHVPFDSIR
jgi:hypothetical protein